jgi:putative DNA primase/helicase
MKYIIINEDKVPQHPLDQFYSLEEVKDYPNLAILIDEPYVVLDVDDSNQALKLYDILTAYNVKCNIMKTDRGCHFWFKTREPMTNNTHINTPITVKVDVKSWGKKSLVTVKKKDIWREWLVKNNDVDEIPFWLTPIKVKKDLIDLDEGDGRDDGLYTYIIPLLKNKFSKHEIEVIFDIINKFIFKKPLLQREIDKMFKDNEIFDETMCFFDKGQFLHHEFAFWLKKNYPIEYFNGQLYLYDNGLYKPNQMGIEELMISKIPKLKNNQRMEVIKYLELISNGKTRPPQNTLVNTLSGMVDIETKKLLPHSDKIFSINQIEAYYNPGTFDEHVDKFLNTITDNDPQIRALLEEMMGYCLLNDCRFQSAFILVGAGANGKSAFLKMLTEFLGIDNVSSIPLEELNGKFETAELVGKLANIGDDISSDFLSDSSVFKKLVTGDKITVQRKFQHPFQFNNIAKLIFSANNLPPVSDKSYGLHRRLVIIPFIRTFKKTDPDYDPNILRKLTTESAKMYLLDIAINGIRRVIENNSFTLCDKVNELLDNYIKENNNCIQWLETTPEIVEIDINTIYRNYCMYCVTYNTKPYKKSRFITEIITKLPYLRVKNTTRNGIFMQVFSEEKKR